MYQLFKPNELIATIGKMKLDRLARHLGNYFFEHAQKKLKFENYEGSTFRVNIKDLNTEAGVSAKDYKLIEKSLKSLQQTVEIRSRDNKRFLSLVMIPEVAIDWTAGEYYFALSPSTIELLKSKEFFTKLELLEMNPLVSKHTLVIFEWLKRYEHSPTMHQMTVEELRKITDTSAKRTYDNFAEVQRKVLDVAVAEICEKTPYQASYEAIKTRAKTRPKVTAIRWTFERKEAAPEQNNVSNTTTQDTSVHGRYAELADLYVRDGFCETEADFYKATYIADLRMLNWFYDAKKHLQKARNKIRYLQGDIEKGSKRGRWQSQRDLYQALFARLSAKDQAFMLEKQGQQGFYEQILILKKHLGDVTPVKDPEKWL